MYIDNPSLFSGSLSGSISLSQAKFEDSLIPKDDNNINLGSPSKRFSKLYVVDVSASTISGLTTSSIPDFDTHVSSAAADAGFGSGGGASIPLGTVSGSQQIEDLGFITSSADGTISSSLQVVSALPNGTVSSSAQITDGSDIFSGSLVAGTNITINQVGDNFEISSSAAGDSTPSGTVSGSQQIEDLGFISGSLVAGTNITINQVGGDFEISSSAAGDSIPSGTISGSQQIENLGFITSSDEGTISGSQQIENLGFLSGSQLVAGTNITINQVGDNFEFSSSAAGDSIPSGTISGSQQIEDLGFITSSAEATDTGSFYVSSSITNNVITFDQGDGTTDTITIPTGGVNTGSFYVSSSVNLNTVTFHQGDGTTESVIIDTGSSASGSAITYVNDSADISSIEVADFDTNVAVTFDNGALKFIFGEPSQPSSENVYLSGFSTDRFNKVEDNYSIIASWNNGGYTLLTASIFEGSTLINETNSGTSVSANVDTSGSHTYTLIYSASSPLDGSIYTSTDIITGNLSKSNPGTPSISRTPTVQLGASSNQIEQGATGSIVFSVSYGSSNSWEQVSLTSGSDSPIPVTGSATGSSSITISSTANYQSPAGDNDPQLTTSRSSTSTYSKIRSVRYGASSATSFTQSELEDLAAWDTTLGGDIGTIDKGNTNPSGDSVTFTWTGDKYHYIVYDSSRSNLTNIATGGFGVLSSFTLTTVGSYKIYRTNTLQAGGAGTSITYDLT